MNAKDTINAIKAAKSVEELEAIVADSEERKTVLKAMNEKMTELLGEGDQNVSSEAEASKEAEKTSEKAEKSAQKPAKQSKTDERITEFCSKISRKTLIGSIISFAGEFFGKDLVEAKQVKGTYKVKIELKNPKASFEVHGK